MHHYSLIEFMACRIQSGMHSVQDEDPRSESIVKLLMLEESPWSGGRGERGAFSSAGKTTDVSTIASKQFTNSSDDSCSILYYLKKNSK